MDDSTPRQRLPVTKKDQTAALRRPRIPEGGCSTIVVGRAASATGRILVGHNEDNDGRIVTNRIWVPAADHAAAERLAFEPGAAVIPQAPHTLAQCWTQTLHPQGASYSDSFINEAGVLVVSNNCNQTWERDEPVVDGGVGYAVRRLIADRARTAREGVAIAVDLQTRWGYRGEGRTYTIADPHEAWQVFLLRGHRWAARRIQDDEVVFTANAFALDRVDDVPPEDVMLSPDLVDYAVRTGRYLPENGLDHSDFSFRRAYQPPERRYALWNFDRARTAWEYLTGRRFNDPETIPYAIRPALKVGTADVMHVLASRSAYEERRGYGPDHRTMRDVSNVGTFDAAVYELHEEPLLTTGWRASGRPSQLPFTPFFPLAGPPAAETLLDVEAARRAHFAPPRQVFDWRADRPLWRGLAAETLADWTDFDLPAWWRPLTGGWMHDGAHIRRAASELAEAAGLGRARAFLHDWNERVFAEADAVVFAAFPAMRPVRIEVLASELSAAMGEVEVALHPAAGFDPAKIDSDTVTFGTATPTEEVEWNARRARVCGMTVEEDGAVRLRFPAEDVLRLALPGVLTDFWIFGLAEGRSFGGFDVVRTAG